MLTWRGAVMLGVDLRKGAAQGRDMVSALTPVLATDEGYQKLCS
jgi:hypothetical protein